MRYILLAYKLLTEVKEDLFFVNWSCFLTRLCIGIENLGGLRQNPSHMDDHKHWEDDYNEVENKMDWMKQKVLDTWGWNSLAAEFGNL